MPEGCAEDNPREAKDVRLLLVAGLLLFLVCFGWYARNNYVCRVVSDPSTYLDFGENLARGHFYHDYPPDRIFQEYFPPQAILRATHTNLYAGGRTFSFADIGYPLFLALFFRLGGRYAPFLANTLVFLGIFALLAAVTWKMLAAHPQRVPATLLAPVLYLLVNRDHLTFLLASYNDPLSYLLLLLSMLFLLRHREGEGMGEAALAGLCLGLAVTVRKTSFVAAAPLLLLWARDAIARRGRVRWRALWIAGVALVVGLAPILLQNWMNTGNPLYSTHVLAGQVWRGQLETLDEDKPISWTGLGPEYVSRSLRRHLHNLWLPLGWGLTAALLLGVWFGRSSPGFTWLLLPFAASFLAFHSLIKIAPWRYVFIVQMVLAPIIALGIAGGAARIGALLRARFLPNAAAVSVLAAGCFVLLTARKPDLFQIAEAEAFRRDVERAVPAGALVIAERPMRRIIDYFSHAYSVKPDDFVREKAGLTFRAGLEHYRRALNGVYFFDAKDGNLSDGYDNTPAVREEILSWYDLTPVATLDAAAYHLRAEFGTAQATLYRLDDWKAAESAHELEVPAPGAAILRLNGRDRGATPAAVRWEGELIDSSVSGGLSWYLLPAPAAPRQRGLLRVTPAAPVPRDLAPVLFALEAPIVLGTGPEAVPRAAYSLSPEFSPAPRAGWSILAGAGKVRIPVFAEPESTVIFTTSVQKREGAAGGRLRLSGGGASAEFDLHGSNWSTLSIPVPRPDAGRNTADITVALDQAGVLHVASCTVSRLRHRNPPLKIEFGRNDEAFLVSGWYFRERGPGATVFRWTDGEARLRLPGSPAATRGAHRLTLRAAGPPGVVSAGQSLRLILNGTPVGSAALKPEIAQDFDFDLAPGLLRPGINELVISSHPWMPRDLLHAKDDRRLGVRLESLRLAAAPQREPSPPHRPAADPPLPGGGA